MYQVRRVHIGKTPQLDELARACGKVYSQKLDTACWQVPSCFSFPRTIPFLYPMGNSFLVRLRV